MKHAIEELRFLTILFADLSGFTALSQSLDPEEVREAIGICFERLNPIITRQGGIIHKYEGDLVIAFFGFPNAHEDDPERSVKVALEMMGSLPGINELLRSRFRLPKTIGLHAGISSGTVFIGEIGSKEKKEYTVMGEIVNLASRLKDTAREGEVMVSETVYRLTRHLFDYEELPPVNLKGIEDEVKIFRPRKVKRNPDPKRGIRGLASPLIGRDVETYLLQNRIQGLAMGWGGAVSIVGEPGIGKTRLWSEARIDLQKNDGAAAVHEGRCDQVAEAAAYLPFRRIIRSILSIPDTAAAADIPGLLASGVQNLIPEGAAEVATYVGLLFSAHVDEGAEERIKFLDPRSLKAQVLMSVKKLLSAAARVRPMVLAIENFQWIDPESRELLEYILKGPPDDPLLFICIYRPEKDDATESVRRRFRERLGDNYSEICLRPLTPESASSLLDHLLGSSPLTPSLRDKILSRAEGNPFYLEEILRNLIDQRVIYQAESGWVSSSDSERFVIPENIQFLITSGLDRLEPESKDVLQRASVLGRDFEVEPLERLTGLDNLSLSLQLATLEEEELVRRGSGEDKGYHFRHPLIHEVAYHSLLKKKRREYHRQAAEFYESGDTVRAAEYSEIIAAHYVNSDQPEKAIEWLKKAGARSREQFAYEEALGHYRRIIAIVEEERLDLPVELRDTYERIGEIQNLKGEYEPAIATFRRAYDLSREPVKKIRIKMRIAYILQVMGRHEESLKCYDEAERIPAAGEAGAEIEYEKINIRISRCSIHRVIGDLEFSRRESRSAIEDLKQLAYDDHAKDRILIKALNNLGLTSWVLGDNQLAIEHFMQSIKICESSGDKRSLSIAYNNLGLVYEHLGDYEQAKGLFQKHLAASRSLGSVRSIGIAIENLAEVAFWQGDYDLSLKHFDEYFKIYQEVGTRIELGMAYGYLSLIARDRGDPAGAADNMTQCMELTKAAANKLELANALCFRGWLNIDRGDLAGAEDDLNASESILRQLSSKYLLIINYFLRSALAVKKGEPIDGSLKYANQAWQLAEEADSSPGRGFAFFAFARVYRKWGETAKAELNFLKARVIFTRIGQKKSLADVLWELSANHEARGQRTEARETRDEAINLYGEMKIKPPTP